MPAVLVCRRLHARPTSALVPFLIPVTNTKHAVHHSPKQEEVHPI